MGRRFVAIGDLNAADDVLIDILRGTKLIHKSGHWIGGETHLVQIGDIWNRGPGARRATELLLDLQPQAEAKGGKVSLILGNHEVMTSLGVEAYCTAEEYLAFATAKERESWPKRVHRAMMKIYGSTPDGKIVPPLAPRVNLWKAQNAPGQKAMRRALGPKGRIGRAMRSWPVIVVEEGLAFVHAGLTPKWAALGVAGLNQEAKSLWAEEPSLMRDLPEDCLFRDDDGPLWDRSLACGDATKAKRAVEASLRSLNAKRMIVGHTRTESIPKGEGGKISTRFGGKLVCIDVGLSSGPQTPRVALLVEGAHGFEWSPQGTRALW